MSSTPANATPCPDPKRGCLMIDTALSVAMSTTDGKELDGIGLLFSDLHDHGRCEIYISEANRSISSRHNSSSQYNFFLPSTTRKGRGVYQ